MSELSGQEIGKVIGLKGSVRAESFDGTRSLEQGSSIFEKEKIITESDSNVEIRFLDNTLLSQGPDSVLRLDEYVFDPQSMENSGLSFNLMQGAFRHVTGRIAEENPERVNLESPLSLIGIRGTTTVHMIQIDHESHGAEDLSEGFRVIIQDSFGEIRIITLPMSMMDVFRDQPMGFMRPMTQQELEFFREFSPAALVEQPPDDDPDDDDTLPDGVGAAPGDDPDTTPAPTPEPFPTTSPMQLPGPEDWDDLDPMSGNLMNQAQARTKGILDNQRHWRAACAYTSAYTRVNSRANT